jgi:S1-C subfamily serine protease
MVGVLGAGTYYQRQVNSLVQQLVVDQSQLAHVSEETNDRIDQIKFRRSLDQETIQSLFRQTVTVFSAGGRGSGVVLDAKQGLVLTCYHCVWVEGDVTIENYCGVKYTTTYKTVELFKDYDLALIHFPFSIDADSAKIRNEKGLLGEMILVLGTPLRDTCMTVGYLSDYFPELVADQPVIYYQTDAAINTGNSGGPWFDENGYLVAVSARKSPSKEAVSFGIPIYYLNQCKREVP